MKNSEKKPGSAYDTRFRYKLNMLEPGTVMLQRYGGLSVMKKKTISVLLLLMILLLTAGFFLYGNSPKVGEARKYSVEETEYKCIGYASMRPEEIVANLSLEQKAAQMVMPAIYNVSPDKMKDNDYGSILSTVGSIDAASWRSVVDEYQNAALLSDAGIPYIYGQDDVHGVNYCLNAVYFPHNIGQGAANKEGMKVYITGPAADDASAQCGGSTIEGNVHHNIYLKVF